jgi:hypothetical protein
MMKVAVGRGVLRVGALVGRTAAAAAGGAAMVCLKVRCQQLRNCSIEDFRIFWKNSQAVTWAKE